MRRDSSWLYTLSVLYWTAAAANNDVVNRTSCGSHTYTYSGLAGYGYIPSNATDKYGDTLGGFGSSAAFDLDSWRRIGPETYTGLLYCIPDRGWNTNGTLNYQARVHTLNVTLHLTSNNNSANRPSRPNLQLTYLDSLLLTDPTGKPLTGLDASADFNDTLNYPGFPPLPAAIYTGNGFNDDPNSGHGGHRVSLDAEGLVLTPDSFWISDEYGPYVYRFDRQTGRMKTAIEPPAAYIPHRNQSISFSADSPPIYDPNDTPIPEDPATGRANNQGFEALTISPDGKTLYTMIQSALDQEGGTSKKYRRPARLLQYDISAEIPVQEHEYVVMLPTYYDYTKGHDVVAAQSEIHLLPAVAAAGDPDDKAFLVLARDSGFGHGQDESLSVYRHADVVRITSNTTDLKRWRGVDGVNGSIASAKGVLDTGITPAEYCPFLDYNVESQLAKFGLHNGGPQDRFLLNEKWESLALVPVEPGQKKASAREREYFLFSLSDNDFITQDGRMNFGRFKYADESGYDLDNQALVFRVKISS